MKCFVVVEGYLKRVDKRNKGKCIRVFISTLLKGKFEISYRTCLAKNSYLGVGPRKIVSVKAKKLGNVDTAKRLRHVPSVTGSEVLIGKCFILHQGLKSIRETWETSEYEQYESQSPLQQLRDDKS